MVCARISSSAFGSLWVFGMRHMWCRVSLITVAIFVSAIRGFCFQPLFDTGVSNSVDSSAASIIAVDIDHDGDKDIVLANAGKSTVSVLKNNGDGTFAPKVDYHVGSTSSSVIAADLDGDGDQDLVVANGKYYTPDSTVYDSTISILWNNGDGTFAAGPNFSVGNSPYSIFAADLDNDGNLDLVVSNSGLYPTYDSTVSILKNNGDGTFAPKVDYVTEIDPTGLVCSDVDGDGDLDIVARCYYFVSVLKNDGSGTFNRKIDYWYSVFGGSNGPIIASDLDGDGDQDLAVQENGLVLILTNDGTGNFAENRSYGESFLYVGGYSITVSDFDGDGDQDLAISYGSGMTVFINSGHGTFFPDFNYEVGGNPGSIAAADFNGDGHPDLVVTNSMGSMDFFKNKGDGTFPARKDYFITSALGLSVNSVTIADLDGDGSQDLVETWQYYNFRCHCKRYGVSALKNDGQGKFYPAFTFGAPIGVSVVGADMDRDGDVDLVCEYGVAYNDGHGNFSPVVGFGTKGQAVVVADLNQDGFPDVAVADSTVDSVSVIKNNGDGSFGSSISYAAGGGAIFASDVDGDGDVDLITGRAVLKNNGDGTFSDAIPLEVKGNKVFLADLDKDGDSDLVILRSDSNIVSVLKNRGSGSYDTRHDYPTGFGSTSIFVADFDGDGNQDLAVSNAGSQSISIYLNDGGGSFSQRVDYAGSNASSMFAGDLDGDGDKELVEGYSEKAQGDVTVDYLAKVTVLTNLSRLGCFPKRGDIDQNCLVTLRDIILELNCVFLESGDCPRALIDLNCDGLVTPSDLVLLLLSFYVEHPFPC